MTDIIRRANKAFSESFLQDVLPALRKLARDNGYALAVHGSLSKDIDLLAVPWTDDFTVMDADKLSYWIVEILKTLLECDVSCISVGDKPHGRKAYTIVFSGSTIYIDLSVMPVRAAA